VGYSWNHLVHCAERDSSADYVCGRELGLSRPYTAVLSSHIRAMHGVSKGDMPDNSGFPLISISADTQS
jgi:hypothetical protein